MGKEVSNDTDWDDTMAESQRLENCQKTCFGFS